MYFTAHNYCIGASGMHIATPFIYETSKNWGIFFMFFLLTSLRWSSNYFFPSLAFGMVIKNIGTTMG